MEIIVSNCTNGGLPDLVVHGFLETTKIWVATIAALSVLMMITACLLSCFPRVRSHQRFQQFTRDAPSAYFYLCLLSGLVFFILILCFNTSCPQPIVAICYSIALGVFSYCKCMFSHALQCFRLYSHCFRLHYRHHSQPVLPHPPVLRREHSWRRARTTSSTCATGFKRFTPTRAASGAVNLFESVT
jgi:hypothetical protein